MKKKIKDKLEWAFYIGLLLADSFLIGILLAHLQKVW